MIIEQTDNSPKVILDFDNGFIEFEGRSYPENTFEFYQPILEWLEDYFLGNLQETTMNFKLTYFNSATTQIIYDILDIVQDNRHASIQINWYYHEDNENAIADYEDYSDEFPDLTIKAVVLQGV